MFINSIAIRITSFAVPDSISVTRFIVFSNYLHPIALGLFVELKSYLQYMKHNFTLYFNKELQKLNYFKMASVQCSKMSLTSAHALHVFMNHSYLSGVHSLSGNSLFSLNLLIKDAIHFQTPSLKVSVSVPWGRIFNGEDTPCQR